jgi:uncharacterized membrane protein YfcA
LFVIGWAIGITIFGLWPVVIQNWGIAMVMIGGSLVAGSTPMGGGSVAFPVLVYGFGQTPEHARDFGLCIQALGMTSALLFIFGRGTRVERRLLWSSCAGAALGLVVGTFVVAPFFSRSMVKLLFACVWMSFAVLTLARNREFCGFSKAPGLDWTAAIRIGVPLGVLGGIIAAMIGVGLEMLIYTVLVLLFRCDLKVAVPTAVCSTAIASIFGVVIHLGIGDISGAVVGQWLACAPLVIFGAPIGTFLVTVISRQKILYFVSALCTFQFGFTLWQLPLSPADWTFVVILMTASVGGFSILYGKGKRHSKAAAAASV